MGVDRRVMGKYDSADLNCLKQPKVNAITQSIIRGVVGKQDQMTGNRMQKHISNIQNMRQLLSQAKKGSSYTHTNRK